MRGGRKGGRGGEGEREKGGREREERRRGEGEGKEGGRRREGMVV